MSSLSFSAESLASFWDDGDAVEVRNRKSEADHQYFVQENQLVIVESEDEQDTKSGRRRRRVKLVLEVLTGTMDGFFLTYL